MGKKGSYGRLAINQNLQVLMQAKVYWLSSREN